MSAMDKVLQLVKPKVSREMDSILTKDVSDIEIYEVIWHLNLNKAQGSYGFLAFFFSPILLAYWLKGYYNNC